MGLIERCRQPLPRKVWGNTIWELWEHNHGLDGSGTAVPGIVPVVMHATSATPAPVTQVGMKVNNDRPLHINHDGSPNTINDLNDPIPVAVLTTRTSAGDPEDFDATLLDPTSVRFGNAADTDQLAENADADGDGDNDANFVFLTGDTGIACDDTSASLIGETLSGIPVSGSAEIETDCDAQ